MEELVESFYHDRGDEKKDCKISNVFFISSFPEELSHRLGKITTDIM